MRKWVGILVVFLVGGLAVVLGVLYAETSADLSPRPRQPIAFSHQRHAGELQINCLFCHRGAPISRTASIPPVYICMTCHRSLRQQTPETEKLLTYWNDKEPIPWVRSQRLPDFVRFTHEMHLDAGFECSECHGEVQRMSETPRGERFKMGWCIECHERNRASLDCFTCHY